LTTPIDSDAYDNRTLVFTPTGRDSQLICNLLERMSLPCQTFASIDDLCSAIRRGAGAAIIAEEALTPTSIQALLRALSDQPSWSDFPVLLLTIGGRVTPESERLRELRRPLGNLFLLERPIRPETLLGTLEIALRGRQRQYQIRDHMARYARAQEALRQSEKLAVTGRLAASIAHEINNPLESVTNLLYLMRNETSLEIQRAYLTTAEQELARVAEVVKQTLRFYRDPGKPVRTELPAVLHSVLVLYHSRLTSSNIVVEPEILSHRAAVLSSPGELRQVIANLVGNSIDAMRGGGRLRVRVSDEYACRRDGNRGVRLTIADTGSGIPQTLLPRIFEPFVTTKGETGTGLGLWVTGEIARRNGWRIAVRSSCYPNCQGTTFSIQMPSAA
jgi:signal transduction histidine kinase